MDAAKDKTDLVTIDHCPVRAIREVLDNEEDVYLGDIGFDRLGDGKILAPPGVEVNDELASRYATENAERVAGDLDIVWTVGGTCVDFIDFFCARPDVYQTILYQATMAEG